jgi:hypothetical protein
MYELSIAKQIKFVHVELWGNTIHHWGSFCPNQTAKLTTYSQRHTRLLYMASNLPPDIDFCRSTLIFPPSLFTFLSISGGVMRG